MEKTNLFFLFPLFLGEIYKEPFLARLVGETQSNISTPRSIESNKLTTSPIPNPCLGRSSGKRGVTHSKVSLIAFSAAQSTDSCPQYSLVPKDPPIEIPS